MKHQCYLIVWLRADTNETLIASGVSLTSEDSRSITHDLHQEVPLRAFKTSGESYEAARTAMVDFIKNRIEHEDAHGVRTVLGRLCERALKEEINR